MSLSAAFTLSQATTNPTRITIVDTSTGTDASVTKRRIYLQKHDGSFLVPTGVTTDYIEWDLADGNILDVDVISRDWALYISMECLDDDDAVQAVSSGTYALTLYTEMFIYSLTQEQTSNPSIINHTNFYNSKLKLICSVEEAKNGILIGLDISSAQAALDRAHTIMQNQNIHF